MQRGGSRRALGTLLLRLRLRGLSLSLSHMHHTVPWCVAPYECVPVHASLPRPHRASPPSSIAPLPTLNFLTLGTSTGPAHRHASRCVLRAATVVAPSGDAIINASSRVTSPDAGAGTQTKVSLPPDDASILPRAPYGESDVALS